MDPTSRGGELGSGAGLGIREGVFNIEAGYQNRPKGCGSLMDERRERMRSYARQLRMRAARLEKLAGLSPPQVILQGEMDLIVKSVNELLKFFADKDPPHLDIDHE